MNGVVVVTPTKKEYHIKINDQIQKAKYRKNATLTPFNELLKGLKGKRNCIVNSDVYDVTNQKIKIKNLEKHNMYKILAKIMNDAIPFLSNIAKEEMEDIVIHITYQKTNPALTVIAGLENDIQVLLFDIHYERNERSIQC